MPGITPDDEAPTRPKMIRFATLLTAILVALAALARADEYPSKPIHVLTTSSAGGISDIFMRVLGEELHKSFGQPLIIDNRPGGAGNIAARACQDAVPDGYTICIINADPMIYNQFLFKNLSFDPDKLAPIRQPLRSDPGAGDQFRSQCQNGRRIGRGVEAEARHTLLSHCLGADGRLHGQPQKRKRRRLGARAVQGRRRSDQRDSRRLDADRPHRARQRDLEHPRRQDDGAGADQQYPHAAVAGCADARRSRLQGRAVADLVRACLRRRARRARSSTRSRRR